MKNAMLQDRKRKRWEIQLLASVNKMIELQAKRLKLQGQSEKEQRKERESLKYRREEAERNRQHELQLTKMYMQMLGMP